MTRPMLSPNVTQALMRRIESAMTPSYWGESHVVTIARNDLAPLVAHIQAQAECIKRLRDFVQRVAESTCCNMSSEAYDIIKEASHD